MHKSIVFCVAFFWWVATTGQYGRRLLLLGDTAEIFCFTFWYTDALSSVYEISMSFAPKSSYFVKQFWNDVSRKIKQHIRHEFNMPLIV